MRGTIAKLLRKQIYNDLSPRVRTYQLNRETYSIIADPLRRAYKELKRRWNHGR